MPKDGLDKQEASISLAFGRACEQMLKLVRLSINGVGSLLTASTAGPNGTR